MLHFLVSYGQVLIVSKDISYLASVFLRPVAKYRREIVSSAMKCEDVIV